MKKASLPLVAIALLSLAACPPRDRELDAFQRMPAEEPAPGPAQPGPGQPGMAPGAPAAPGIPGAPGTIQSDTVMQPGVGGTRPGVTGTARP